MGVSDVSQDQGGGVAIGDEVRFVHNWVRHSGIVSSIDKDGAMVCMPIGRSYQLRGPVPLSYLERIDRAR